MMSRTLAIAFVVSVIGEVFLDTSGAFVVVTSGVVVVAIRISLALKGYLNIIAEVLPFLRRKTLVERVLNRYLLDDMGSPEVASFGLGCWPLVRRNFAPGLAIRTDRKSTRLNSSHTD